MRSASSRRSGPALSISRSGIGSAICWGRRAPIPTCALCRPVCSFRCRTAISDRAASALMMKGMTAQYLFRQVYPLKGGETILYHAAAGGVGLIACQWARALGVTMIGTVSTDEKAEARPPRMAALM